MLTTNIDVSDALTNGAMGTVANIITDEITGEMKTILVEFDNDNVAVKPSAGVCTQIATQCCSY